MQPWKKQRTSEYRYDPKDFVLAIRGAFSSEEDQSELKNGVPVFQTKDEAKTWCEKLFRSPGSIRPGLFHCVTTFIGWDEVSKYLIPRILGEASPYCVRIKPSNLEPSPNNVFLEEECKPIMDQLLNRLSLPHHARLSLQSTLNTFKYCYFHMRCGILVQIRNSKLVTFAPFVNDQYRNSWGKFLKFEPSPLSVYYKEKQNHYRRENILPDVETWWANGNIICNEPDSNKEVEENQFWGDNLLLPFKHMLEKVCENRMVGDVDFFFNKRDHPQMRNNPLIEPYDFLFDQKDTLIVEKDHHFSMLTPVLSFYCSDIFSDIPIPTIEDWKGANGWCFPESSIPPIKEAGDLYLKENFSKFESITWEEKVETAFFRGNATGGGVLPSTNQRLNLCEKDLKQDKSITPPMLDCGITGFNMRDKKLFGEPMKFANSHELKKYKKGFIPMYDQGKYKYLIYVEGHCAANRYSFLMRIGSVILKIKSNTSASQLWFFPLLKSQDCSRDFTEADTEADHVDIEADLSDLYEKIAWCKRNDAVCKRVAENAKKFVDKYLSEDALLDYWELVLHNIGKKQVFPPADFVPRVLPIVSPPVSQANKFCAGQDKETRQGLTCRRCQEDIDDGR